MNLNDRVLLEVHQDWTDPDQCGQTCQYFNRASGNEYVECRLFGSLTPIDTKRTRRHELCNWLAVQDYGTTGCEIDTLRARITDLECQLTGLVDERDELRKRVAELVESKRIMSDAYNASVQERLRVTRELEDENARLRRVIAEQADEASVRAYEVELGLDDGAKALKDIESALRSAV